MEKRETIHSLFKTITVLKIIHGIIELVLALALLILTKEFISNMIISFVDGRLVGDPNGFIAQHISQFGIDLSLSIKLFFSFYLGSHGIINLSLVFGVIKKPSIAYPISLFAFICFLIYQTYDYFVSYSWWMLALIIFDILFISLLFYEYNTHLKTHSFLGKLKLIVKAEVPQIVKIKLPVISIIKTKKAETPLLKIPRYRRHIEYDPV